MPLILPPSAAPSRLILPRQPLTPSGGAIVQRPSGLYVPDSSVSVPSSGRLTVVEKVTADQIPGLARAAYSDIAKKFGAAAADPLVGEQVRIADRVHKDIVHDRLIEALRQGRLPSTWNPGNATV